MASGGAADAAAGLSSSAGSMLARVRSSTGETPVAPNAVNVWLLMIIVTFVRVVGCDDEMPEANGWIKMTRVTFGVRCDLQEVDNRETWEVGETRNRPVYNRDSTTKGSSCFPIFPSSPFPTFASDGQKVTTVTGFLKASGSLFSQTILLVSLTSRNASQVETALSATGFASAFPCNGPNKHWRSQWHSTRSQ